MSLENNIIIIFSSSKQLCYSLNVAHSVDENGPTRFYCFDRREYTVDHREYTVDRREYTVDRREYTVDGREYTVEIYSMGYQVKMLDLIYSANVFCYFVKKYGRNLLCIIWLLS